MTNHHSVIERRQGANDNVLSAAKRPLTIKDMVDVGRLQLAGSETARLDAEVLLTNVLDVDRAQLYGIFEDLVPPDKRRRYGELIGKRRRGVPVAYLTGHREFWSLDIYVDENTFIPRPETEHLVEATLDLMSNLRIEEVADLGTGSGAVALAIANEYPQCRVIATDICEKALAVAARNATHLGLTNITLRQGHWCGALNGAQLELIVSNPPYVASCDPCLREGDVSHEPTIALLGGEQGLDAIRTIVTQAGAHIRSGGWLLIEHASDQKKDVWELMRAHGLGSLKTCRDYGGHDRVTVGRRI